MNRRAFLGGIVILVVGLCACRPPAAPPADTPPVPASPTLTGAPPAQMTRSAPSPVPPSSTLVGASPVQPTRPAPSSSAVIPPAAFEYLGAFRLPGEGERPRTFAYGGNAMTFNPQGDPGGPRDGFPGSLFIIGHDRIAYGDLPDGGQLAEVSIPVPLRARDVQTLNTAGFLQDFQDVLAGYFTDLEEIPRVGLAYLDRPETGPRLHLAWGQHLQTGGEPSHVWLNPDLSAPQVRGVWRIGQRDPYSVNGYLFEIPAVWADAYTGGRCLATGRMRDGGLGGMGPALFAYRPWLPDGAPAPDGAHLSEVPLLLYESAANNDQITRSLNGYQHPDEWEGGAWLTTPTGKQAVLFAGTKSTGQLYWYGYIHPQGADIACVDTQADGYASMCRHADGSLCQGAELAGCCDASAGTCVSNRGWWSTRFDAQIILYDPVLFERVTRGELEPWQPQPYAVLDIDEYLFLSAPEWDQVNVGWGAQRRYRVGDVAFDRQNGLLYLLEWYADEAKPLVHTWRIRP